MGNKIDFVIIWVDGNDPEWRAEKNRYQGLVTNQEDASDQRYRDWDILQYWFRGVENFCPWVNKVHFVTWGHLPPWLNVNNDKLNIVRHQDYIPACYLPTFSSHTIELNLHRIMDLSEHFVYFNDDMFVIAPMRETDFFRNGKPCDSAIMNVHCYNMEEMVILTPFRDIGVINHEFNMKDVIKNNPIGWFNPRYGINVIRNMILLACPRFPGMLQQHLPTSFCKTSFQEVWDKYYDILNETCKHKFREITDVNQWLIKEWQLAKNAFYPRALSIGSSLPLYTDTYKKAAEFIKTQRKKMVCINDVEMTEAEYIERREEIKKAFDKILPKKSLFEK